MEDRNAIKQHLNDMLSALFPNAGIDADILVDVDLIDDLNMDSITFISIVVEIEDIFGITVPDDMLLMESFRNVDRIIHIIESAENSFIQNEKGHCGNSWTSGDISSPRPIPSTGEEYCLRSCIISPPIATW